MVIRELKTVDSGVAEKNPLKNVTGHLAEHVF